MRLAPIRRRISAGMLGVDRLDTQKGIAAGFVVSRPYVVAPHNSGSAKLYVHACTIYGLVLYFRATDLPSALRHEDGPPVLVHEGAECRSDNRRQPFYGVTAWSRW